MDDIQEAGYKSFPKGAIRPGSDRLYQHTVWVDGKKAYFINLYHYLARADFPVEAIEGDVELYLPSDRWLTLQIHNAQDWELPDLEAFIFETWRKLGCVPDLHNN